MSGFKTLILLSALTALLMALGVASAIMGALRAALEEDTKTLLACSTIENIGLITAGLGLALAFRAADLGALSAVAAGAALLHALNHAMFKTLLFLGAGEVLHGAASRRMDRLGGLIHAMPWTAGLVLVGAAAAAALPPLSGFASEWLLLQALIAAWRVGDLAFQIGAAAATAMAALAAARCMDAGWQCALMAPTEILAEQHYRKLSDWFGRIGLEVVWLTGSLKKKDKQAALAKVGAGGTALRGESQYCAA
mgnify:CR=1 FL=1